MSRNNMSATLTSKNNHQQLLTTHLAQPQHLRTLLNGATPRKAHFSWVATDENDSASLKAPWPTAVAKQGPLSHGCHACCCWPSHCHPSATIRPVIVAGAVQISRPCVLRTIRALCCLVGHYLQLCGPTRYIAEQMQEDGAGVASDHGCDVRQGSWLVLLAEEHTTLRG